MPYLCALLATLFLLPTLAWGAGGDLLWVDTVTAIPNSSATSIVAKNNLVFSAGETNLGVDVYEFILRAYDAETGTLVWSDTGPGVFDRIAEAGGRVFAAGTDVSGPNHTRPGFFLRAYEEQHGQLLWQVSSDSDALAAMVSTDSAVLIAGWNGTQFLVRAYSATTGGVLWENMVPGQALSIAVGQNRVFVGGRSAVNDFLLRAYDAISGVFLWQQETPNYLAGLATDGQRVFAVGSTDASWSDWLVRAYKASVGTLVWEDIAKDLAPTGICSPPYDPVPCSDIAFDVDPEYGRLFVLGISQNPATGGTGTVLRTYDTTVGALMWEDQRTASLTLPQVVGIHAGSGQAFTVTRCCGAPDTAALNFRLRAYNAQTGAVNWEDQVNGWVEDFTVEAGRVVTAGGVGPNPESSFLVSAYDAGRRAPKGARRVVK